MFCVLILEHRNSCVLKFNLLQPRIQPVEAKNEAMVASDSTCLSSGYDIQHG
jgi:hypothetical protein